MLNLKKIITRRGLTTKTVADFLGVSEKTLSNKLSSRSDFTYKEACKLKALLPEYDLDYLLSEEPEIA